MTVERPNPDDLLSVAQHEDSQQHRGKLKIFLGASAGVGKTYTMLQDATLRRQEGLDVLVGLVETHRRAETEKMLAGFEILPRLEINYRDKKLQEFDLDAALQRSPALILVDEMAHTNADGCRHAKRWQDIKELLDRGIDVYTTLNVQHIESLNDIVAQITHIKVHETVPDSILELANTIELVDLPPDDLLKRLQEGKIYIPEQAQLAMQGFFKKHHLVALRELALRFTAERVNDEVLLQRKSQSIEKTWPTAERLLVCVGPGEGAAKLIRATKRMATRLQAEWIAVYVEAPRLHLSEKQRESVFENLRLAETLEAETKVLSGNDVVQEIITYANSVNASKIILGKQVRSRWKNFLFGNLVDELIRYSGDIDIYIIRGDEWEEQNSRKVPVKKTKTDWKGYVVATLYTLLATVFNLLLAHLNLGDSNLIMVYLLTVVMVAMRGHRGQSIWISCLSVVLYDFFFIPPEYTIGISFADTEYLITLGIMMVVAQVISHLTLRIQEQTVAVRKRERYTSILYSLSKQLATQRNTEALLNVATRYIGDAFSSQVMILLADVHHKLHIGDAYQTEKIISDKEQSVAQWAYDLKQMAGLGTQTLPSSEALYIPLTALHLTIGILRIKPSVPKQLLDPEQLRLLEACVNQIALALENSLAKTQVKN